ncbi:MAG: PhzF family phenazine biosynthesis protein [Acidimicrobiales bacterium]
MARARAFVQVDVFGAAPYAGNPLGVVLEAQGLSGDEMQQLTSWANLSETTFVLAPTDPGADYLARIFSPMGELPFAGHPTLGTAHAWMAHTGAGKERASVVQECGAGLVTVRRSAYGLAFEAPPLQRSGPVETDLVAELASGLGIGEAEVVEAQWVDNGPGWVALLLEDAASVLALHPGTVDRPVGAVGFYDQGEAAAYEVRAFFPKDGVIVEDPVTGSLNASLAQWLVGSGRIRPPYMVSQGTALGRRGRVHVDCGDDGEVWVGGQTVTCIRGQVFA